MVNVGNIIESIAVAFGKRKDTVGGKIGKDVKECVEELKKRKHTKEELQALHTCYQAAYSDSMASMNSIIAMIPIFLGLDFFFNMLPIPEIAKLYIKGIITVLLLVYLFRKISVMSRENAHFRNYVMASAILMAEADTQKGKN